MYSASGTQRFAALDRRRAKSLFLLDQAHDVEGH